MIKYKGSRWFKCDFHVHTTSSICFEDKTITAEKWVANAIEKGLNCVAVTDHNSSLSIDKIKKAAEGTSLTVFPGVELTCDTSKIHLLVLFDVNKTSNDVNYFLARADIRENEYGKQDTNTTQSILQIAELAKKDGALIIPAHIDEYNGLGSLSVDVLKKLYSDYGINAVQVVHKEFLDINLNTVGNDTLRTYLNEYYSKSKAAIDDSIIKEWYTPVKYALEANLAILTFSDNPHEPNNTKHGIWGIGEKYTWIKMDESPSLEGLRQAFLLPDFRVQNFFSSTNFPYKLPDLWIKSIEIINTTITNNSTPLKVEFSPQLNTIIGGRGSGKSSILRFMRGLFNCKADIQTLYDILEDQESFYKKHDFRTKKGVFLAESILNIEIARNQILYKIKAENINSSDSQQLTIYKYNRLTNEWEIEDSESFIDFFQFEQYSQKQIYEIAQEPNSLRERIDNSIFALVQIKQDQAIIKKEYLEKSASIRTKQQQITGKGKLITEIKDIEEQIKRFQQSGISGILQSREKFLAQKNALFNFISELKIKEANLEALISEFSVNDIDYSNFESEYSIELARFSKSAIDNFQLIKQELEKQRNLLNMIHSDFNSEALKSKWKDAFMLNQNELETKKAELEKLGIDDISNFEKLSILKENKEKELAVIVAIESNLTTEIAQKQQLQNDFFQKLKTITDLRQTFVTEKMQDDRVKVSIKPFRNKTDFHNKLRSILQRQNSFESDIEYLMNICFSGNVEQTIKQIRQIFEDIISGADISSIQITGHFVNLVKGLSNEQLDEISLLLPEDEIEIQYKPSGSNSFKPLSTASAGQKTTAILTFILSQGTSPLILDQPEDDLDNKLVYELVVDRLKKAKDHRQIIVVTHNANIPVNGDSEYIISMDSESKTLNIICSGTVEQNDVKKEICDVMEGGEKAFDMRSKRYLLIK